MNTTNDSKIRINSNSHCHTNNEVYKKENLFRVVNGALKSAIDVHGPITKANYTSATKRISCTINAYLKQTIKSKFIDEITKRQVIDLTSTINQLKSNIQKLKEEKMYTVQFKQEDFSEVVPKNEGTYAVRKKESQQGFSNAQVVRVFKVGDQLLVSGPNWPVAKKIEELSLLWGPKIEIEVDAKLGNYY